MYSHKRKSIRDSNVLKESYSERERERIPTEHREIRDVVEMRADHAAQGENAALSKPSEAENHTRLLLGEQENHILSEARSELNMQELRVRADGALHEANQYRIGGKRKSSSRNSFEKSVGDGRIEKFCSTEAARAQQLRRDELSR